MSRRNRYRNGKWPPSALPTFTQPADRIALETARQEFLGQPPEPVATPLARDGEWPRVRAEARNQRVDDHEGKG